MKNNFYFKGNFSNIYKEPRGSSEVTSQIIYGERLKIFSKNRKWIKIKTSYDNYTGYIKNKQYIKNFNPYLKSNVSENLDQKLVKFYRNRYNKR